MACSCSIVPKVNEEKDRDVYLVQDTFGEMGLAWRDTDEADTERAALVRDLLDGQDPVRIVALTPPKAGHATSPKILPTNSMSTAPISMKFISLPAGFPGTAPQWKQDRPR